MGFSGVGAKALAEPKGEGKTPEDLTIVCRFCQEEIWKISPRADRKKDGIGVSDLKPAQKFKVGIPTYLPLDCPFCGDEVFLRGYHGGFFVLTLEKGEYPGVRATRTGLRIPPGAFGWFDRSDRMRDARHRMLGVRPPTE